MNHPTFEQVRMTDATVHRMLQAGRTLEEIVAVLAMEKRVLNEELTTAKLRQPITYVVPSDMAGEWKQASNPEPVLPEGLPPLPPGTRYAGQLKDHEGRVHGFICATEDPSPEGWEESILVPWMGMAHDPTRDEALWHVAVPIEPGHDATPKSS